MIGILSFLVCSLVLAGIWKIFEAISNLNVSIDSLGPQRLRNCIDKMGANAVLVPTPCIQELYYYAKNMASEKAISQGIKPDNKHGITMREKAMVSQSIDQVAQWVAMAMTRENLPDFVSSLGITGILEKYSVKVKDASQLEDFCPVILTESINNHDGNTDLLPPACVRELAKTVGEI